MAAITAMCFLVSSCASTPASMMFGPGNFYSDTAKAGTKRGEETNSVYLGFIGNISWQTVEKVAKTAGITKIATVEHYSKPGILWLWTEYTTIVTGE